MVPPRGPPMFGMWVKGPDNPRFGRPGIAAGGTALRGLCSGYRENQDRGLKNLPQFQVLAKFNLQKCIF
jgi:hypothetical protein